MNIQSRLYELRDERYADFQRRLLPTVKPEAVIGVRTPMLRRFAKELRQSGEAQVFLDALPHRLFDENQLHVLILSAEGDYETALREVERFLPYIDNWATCDQLVPKAFARHRDRLFGEVVRWTKSEAEYTIRFGIKMLMSHYLDDLFRPEMPHLVAVVRREEYYIRMMQAWYFATALAKQWESAIAFFETPTLDVWTHNKAIQKAIESYRVSDDHKSYLRTLKR